MVLNKLKQDFCLKQKKLSQLNKKLRSAKFDRNMNIVFTATMGTMSALLTIPGLTFAFGGRKAYIRLTGDEYSRHNYLVDTNSTSAIGMSALSVATGGVAYLSYKEVELRSADIEGLLTAIELKMADIEKANQLLSDINK